LRGLGLGHLVRLVSGLPSLTGCLNASNLNNRYWLPFRKRRLRVGDLHTFRKTVATLMDHADLTARQVAGILGHANPSMTLDVYFGRGQVTREGAKALDRAIGSPENRQ
jgi:integrase